MDNDVEESMVEVEAATCAKPSKYYKGPCLFNDKGCAKECMKENWPGGKCTLSDVRCECQRPC